MLYFLHVLVQAVLFLLKCFGNDKALCSVIVGGVSVTIQDKVVSIHLR